MMTKYYTVRFDHGGSLSVSTRPRGGDWLEDEFKAFSKKNIDVVVSLLEPEEERELDLQTERLEAKKHKMTFMNLPIADRGIPSSHASFRQLIEQIGEAVERNQHVLVHCRQGIGRAGLVAAAVLIHAGMSADDAIERVSQVRGVPVPETVEQKHYLDEYQQSLALH